MDKGIVTLSRSATDICADYLRSAILSGDFTDGMPLVIDRIAAKLGVSHTPIREAIRRLEAEGFVVYAPRKGATVRRIDASEFEELVGIRYALEPLLLERAVEKTGISGYPVAVAALERWKKKTVAAEMLDAQWAFFHALYAPSGQLRILEIVSANWRHIQRYHQVSWVTSQQIRETDFGFKFRLLEACEKGGKDDALARLDEAIEWGSSLVTTRLAG